MAFTENSKVKELLANEKAVGIIEKYYPGLTKHPLLSLASGFTLKRISQMNKTGLTKEMYDKILAELKAI